MGCFASKPAVHPSPSISTAPPLWSEGPSHSHEANRDASRAPASSSRPNVATQAPPSPSEHAPDRAIRDARLTAQPRSQAPHTGNTTSAPSYQGAAGTTTLLVQPNIEHNRPKPTPSSFQSVPINRSKSAQPLSQWGLPPQAVLASSPPHNDGMFMSLPSQGGGVVAVSPPAQPNVEASMSRPHESDVKRHIPSSYRSTPPVKRSMSAQALSQSGLAGPSSRSLARTTSGSESSSDPKSKDISRKLPRSFTLGTNRVHGAEDNRHAQFPSTVRTVLSDGLRCVPRHYLIIHY
jgi:hypothetical protein